MDLLANDDAQRRPTLPYDIPPRPDTEPDLSIWVLQYRHRFPNTWRIKDHTDRVPLVRWCILNADIYRGGTEVRWAEQLRRYMNYELGKDYKLPQKLLGRKGGWVKDHQALRAAQLEETGTVQEDDDYLQQMETWVFSIVEPHHQERDLARSNAAAAAAQREIDTNDRNSIMAVRIRDRVVLHDQGTAEIEEDRPELEPSVEDQENDEVGAEDNDDEVTWATTIPPSNLGLPDPLRGQFIGEKTPQPEGNEASGRDTPIPTYRVSSSATPISNRGRRRQRSVTDVNEPPTQRRRLAVPSSSSASSSEVKESTLLLSTAFTSGMAQFGSDVKEAFAGQQRDDSRLLKIEEKLEEGIARTDARLDALFRAINGLVGSVGKGVGRDENDDRNAG